MASATVSIEFANGDTAVWNVTDDQARDVVESHLLTQIGFPDLLCG